MNKINRSAIVAYSQKQMYDLVIDIAAYPQFLPWCSHVDILESTSSQTTAKLGISFKGVKQSFTTQNINHAYDYVDMSLVDGPFSHLTGQWHVKPLSDSACKIELNLEFSFSSHWLEKIVGPVFGMIGNTMVESFHSRAKTIYG